LGNMCPKLGGNDGKRRGILKSLAVWGGLTDSPGVERVGWGVGCYQGGLRDLRDTRVG